MPWITVYLQTNVFAHKTPVRFCSHKGTFAVAQGILRVTNKVTTTCLICVDFVRTMMYLHLLFLHNTHSACTPACSTAYAAVCHVCRDAASVP